MKRNYIAYCVSFVVLSGFILSDTEVYSATRVSSTAKVKTKTSSNKVNIATKPISEYFDTDNPKPIVRTPNITYFNMGSLAASGILYDKNTGSFFGGNVNLGYRKDECELVIKDCIRRVCKSKTELQAQGAYTYCATNSMTVVSKDVEDCMLNQSVLENRKYNEYCQGYVVDLMMDYYKESVQEEENFVSNSSDCVLSKKAVNAAVKCYDYLIQYNGVFDNNLMNALRPLCGGGAPGGSEEMLSRFFSAGSYGFSNVVGDATTIGEAFASGVEQKRSNWKEVVAVIYSSYVSQAKTYCGEAF